MNDHNVSVMLQNLFVLADKVKKEKQENKK